MKQTIKYTLLLFIVASIAFFVFSCDGTIPVFTNNTSSVTATVEYDYEMWNKWNVGFSENSIEEADTSLAFSFSTTDRNLQTFRYFTFYGDPTTCDVMEFFDDTTANTRHTSHPFYLCFSYYFFLGGILDSILGLSSFENLKFTNCTRYRNWTYVFKANLDLAMGSDTNLTTAYNWCITHELGHQIGRMAGNDAHNNHDGPSEKWPQCIMNWLTLEIKNIIDTSPDYMYFCPKHVKYIKDSVSESKAVDKLTEENTNSSASKKENASTLSISLSKNEYKKFEPILARFDYVNNNSHYDTIYFNFYKYFEGVQFFITRTDDNKTYKDGSPSPFLVMVGPRYFIAPKDTFSVSMVMNYGYGEPNHGNYFGTMGHLEPGNYTVYAQDFFGGTLLKTNEASFKVIENDSVDIKILELATSKKYQEIVDNFPLSPFREHALAMVNWDSYPTETFNINTDNVSTMYMNFLTEYPNSLYNMNIEFVDSYIVKMANKTESFSNLFSTMQAMGKETLFGKFINNKTVKERLSKTFYSRKQKLEEQRKNNKIKK